MNIFSKSQYKLICILIFLLSSCAQAPRFISKNEPKPPSSSPTSLESNKNNSKVHSDKPLLVIMGVASYYSDDFHGKKTSNGEIFDMNALTAAHRTFPFQTKVRVTNLENGLEVIVRINDRGPFAETRIIDLSYGAAKTIDMIGSGTAKVKLEVLEWGDGR